MQQQLPAKVLLQWSPSYINLPAPITFTFLPNELSEHVDRHMRGDARSSCTYGILVSLLDST
jgi:hypothetical protein